jgi:hypothetical protein
VWIIQEKSPELYQFKHIDTGLFLYCSGKKSNCELNKEGSIFTIEVSPEGHC